MRVSLEALHIPPSSFLLATSTVQHSHQQATGGTLVCATLAPTRQKRQLESSFTDGDDCSGRQLATANIPVEFVSLILVNSVFYMYLVE